MNNIKLNTKIALRFKKYRSNLTDSLFLNELLNVYEQSNVKDPKIEKIIVNKEIEPITKRNYKKKEI